jgi:hypothetical protein
MLGLGFVSYRPLDRWPWHKTKRPGLGLSHKALSRSALPQVLLNHRIEPQLFPVNGTAVPDDITLRPYCDSPPCLNFVSAGGGALRRAVTRLKDHGPMPSPPVQHEHRDGEVVYRRSCLTGQISVIEHMRAQLQVIHVCDLCMLSNLRWLHPSLTLPRTPPKKHFEPCCRGFPNGTNFARVSRLNFRPEMAVLVRVKATN